MIKKLVVNGSTKYLTMDKDIFGNLEEVDVQIDTINKKMIISWE